MGGAQPLGARGLASPGGTDIKAAHESHTGRAAGQVPLLREHHGGVSCGRYPALAQLGVGICPSLSWGRKNPDRVLGTVCSWHLLK